MIGLVGMKVFRCAVDKRPQNRNGHKGAMPWRRVPTDWPRVGVPTGADNGIDVLDDRGRDGDCSPPPAQTRTGPIKASGSYLEYLTAKRALGQG